MTWQEYLNQYLKTNAVEPTATIDGLMGGSDPALLTKQALPAYLNEAKAGGFLDNAISELSNAGYKIQPQSENPYAGREEEIKYWGGAGTLDQVTEFLRQKYAREHAISHFDPATGGTVYDPPDMSGFVAPTFSQDIKDYYNNLGEQAWKAASDKFYYTQPQNNPQYDLVTGQMTDAGVSPYDVALQYHAIGAPYEESGTAISKLGALGKFIPAVATLAAMYTPLAPAAGLLGYASNIAVNGDPGLMGAFGGAIGSLGAAYSAIPNNASPIDMGAASADAGGFTGTGIGNANPSFDGLMPGADADFGQYGVRWNGRNYAQDALQYGSDEYLQAAKDMGINPDIGIGDWIEAYAPEKLVDYIKKTGTGMIKKAFSPSSASYAMPDFGNMTNTNKGYNALNYQTTNNLWKAPEAVTPQQAALQTVQAAQPTDRNKKKETTDARMKYLKDYIFDITGKPTYLADYIA